MKGAHGVLVTAPNPKAFNQSLEIVRRGGTIALIGNNDMLQS